MLHQVKTYKIKSNPNNPRLIKGDKFKKLVKSIKEFPEMLKLRPIVVNKEMIVLGGNMRLKACIDAGLKEVWIAKAEELTPEQEQEFIVKDNSNFGEWDWDVLANEWDVDKLNEWGLDLDFKIESEAEEDNYQEPEDLKVDVVLGDLIEIGQHRLLCGDSTDPVQVAKLMDGQKTELIHADPPYGMGKEKDGVLNDNIYDEKLDQFQMKWINAFRPYTNNNGSIYIWGNAPDLWRLWYKGGLKDSEHLELRNEIVWDKKAIAGMKSDLMHQYPEASERCLYIQIGKQFIGNVNTEDFPDEWEGIRSYLDNERLKAGIEAKDVKRITGTQMKSHWFSKSQFTLMPEKYYNLFKKEYAGCFEKPYEELKEEWTTFKNTNQHAKFLERLNIMRSYFNNAHDIMRDVWEFPRVYGDERYGHATPKPVEMICRIIKSSSLESLVEPFLGSGSTMVAAHQLNRKCYGMELDPKYCQVVIDRMKKLDPEIEIKINGKKYEQNRTP